MQNDKLEYSFRRMKDGDLNFILNSWLTSYRLSPYTKRIGKEMYYQFHQEKLKALLERKPNVLLACAPDYPDQIFGYIVYEFDPDVIHYLHVKKTYRKLGIADALLQVLDINNKPHLYTHFTLDAAYITTKYKDNLIFNPYLF